LGEPGQDGISKAIPLLRSPLVRRMFKNSAYLFSATGLAAAASLVQGIFIARMLGVSNFGMLGTITLFTGVVNNVASFRMDELVVKYVGFYNESGDVRAAAIFKLATLVEVGSSLLAYALVWLFAPLGALYFTKDPAMAQWFIIYGAVVLFNLITESSTGLLQIFDRFRRIAVINAGQSIIMLTLTCAVFVDYEFLGKRLPLEPLFLVILIYMSGKLLGALSLARLALKEAHLRWGAGWWKTPLSLLHGQFTELLRFAISTNLSATINLINKDSELLWVAYFRNPVEVGYYKLALSLANLVQMPVNPMPNATYPELARQVARKEWGSVRHLLRQGSYAAGGYTLLASLGLLLLGQPLIHYFYTSQYLPAYPALLILLVGLLVANVFYWRRIILLALGLPHHLTRVNFWAALLKVAGYVLLIPVFGYLGCAALLAGFYVFSSALNVRKAMQTLSVMEKQEGEVVLD